MNRFLRAVTPPVVADGARRLKHGRPWSRRAAEWEYVPEGWARADPTIRGWDTDGVVDAYLAKLPAFRELVVGPGPLGVATSAAVPIGAPSVFEHNTVMTFGYSLARASRDTSCLSVLDWGGGFGFSYLLSRALLPAEVELEYHCKDTPLIARAGRDAIPEVHFWDDDSCLDREYDFVVASSALQYCEPWTAVLERMARASSDYLLLTRVPVVVDSPSFVVLQRAEVFTTEYLSWVFNRQELLDTVAGAGLGLVREFLLGYQPHVVGAPEQDETRAYLFQRTPLGS